MGFLRDFKVSAQVFKWILLMGFAVHMLSSCYTSCIPFHNFRTTSHYPAALWSTPAL